MILADITRRLLHTNRNIQLSMKESIFNIKLSWWPAFDNSYCKKCSNNGFSNNRRKCLRKIDHINLSEAFCHKQSFKPFQRTTSFQFCFTDPFATYHIHVWMSWFKSLSIIFSKSSKRFLHSYCPSRMLFG